MPPDENTKVLISKPGILHGCGLEMTINPHPDAGKSPQYLEIGCTYECLPCMVKSRHEWAQRAQAAEAELRELKASLAAARDPIDILKELVAASPTEITGIRRHISEFTLGDNIRDIAKHVTPDSVRDALRLDDAIATKWVSPKPPTYQD